MVLEESRNNKIHSFVIVSIFTVFVSIIIYFVCYYFELGPFSIVIALAFSFISSFISYYNSDKIVLSMNGARPANEEEDKMLSNILDGLCISSGLPTPKLYIIDDPSPNAFATGRNPENAVICFTTGIIEKLNREELEGVMAHELSHIKNYDILLSTVVSIFVGMVVMLSDILLRSRILRTKSDSKSKANGILMLVGLLLLVLSPIFTTLMQLALSRKREYLADSTAVEFTRNPEGLANALIKISSDNEPLKTANKATAHMYISEPYKKSLNANSLFSTHPPIQERVDRLLNIK